MKVYFAGASRVEEGYPELQKEVSKRLVSYHYMTPSLDEFYYHTERDKYDMIILDSGAFSAWSQGAKIGINEYKDYCVKWQDKVDLIVNLDVIPAYPGKKNIELEEIERSASEGYKNYWTLIDAGIDPNKLIHVFHQNERMEWLEKMVHKDNMPYIGLSPANDRTVKEKQYWLDECMPYVSDSNGAPIVKYHGFAVTSFDVMRRYPWYSVDSSTWAVAGGRGDTFIPIRNREDGTFDFTKPPHKFGISQIAGKSDHITSLKMLPPSIQKDILAYLESKNMALGSSQFRRVSPDYEINKKIGEKKCSGSFIINKGLESAFTGEADKGGLLTSEQMKVVDVNRHDVFIDYEGENGVWIEHILEKGSMNYWKDRQLLNAVFMNEFVNILDAQEPRSFDFNVKVGSILDNKEDNNAHV